MTSIYPFAARPDVAVPVIWYLVPMGTPVLGFPSPMVQRQWDRIQQQAEPDLGTKYDPKLYLTPPGPNIPAGKPCGTAEQWLGEIDYDVYLAGGYTCACPTVTMGVYVIDVYDPTGSLTVSPHDSHVLLNVNDLFSHHWLAGQYFQGGSPSEVPITIALTEGQTANVLEVVNDLGNRQVYWRAPVDDLSIPSLNLARRDGTVLVTLSDGTWSMESGETGQTFRLDVGDPVKFSGQSFWWLPNHMVGWYGGQLAVGRVFSAGNPATLPAELTIDATYASGDLGIVVNGLLAGLAADVFHVAGDGGVAMPGIVTVGPVGAGLDGTLNVWSYNPAHPSALFVAAPKQLVEVLRVEDSAAEVLFAIGPAGEIQSNQPLPAVGPVGNVVGKMPVYNPEGGLIGFVPIYDDIP